MLPPHAADTTPDKSRLCKLSRFLLDPSKRILLQAGREKPIICRGFFFQPAASIGDSKMQSILQAGVKPDGFRGWVPERKAQFIDGSR
jgi:hypothetical protein